nr:BTAD domain-containing putative transcriptional regulator [Streptomyces sp. SID11385]
MFEELCRRGRAELPGDPARAAELLREALALWRGDPPIGAAAARAGMTRLEELRRAALADRVTADLSRGESHALLPELEQLTVAEPTCEQWYVLLMRALRACGRQGEALRVYARARTVLAEELGADPSAELRRAHLAVLRDTAGNEGAERSGGRGAADGAGGSGSSGAQDRPAGASPPRTAPPPDDLPPPGNLPLRLTPLLGREQERELLTGLLEEARLVTLVGPGGVGKTRLSIEIAEEVAGRFGDGAWFVDLSGLSDSTQLAGAVLGTVGAQGPTVLQAAERTPSGAPAERLAAAIGRRRLLLVLDNCEHQLDAVAELVEGVLTSCPGAHVLATSREPLAVAGERLVPLEPLRCPPPGACGPALFENAAVRLFTDRAVTVRPSFALTESDASGVARICRVLDGLPLAIELAASRLRALSIAQIAERLEDRFRLLVGGRRAQPARHRTLEAVVSWSWDLLDADERELAMLLAAFTGGATLETVESLWAALHPPGEAVRDVLDLLTALVDKSLVSTGEAESGVRYRMLGTIQEYLRGKLAASGGESRVRRAHAEHFLAFAESSAPELLRAGQVRRLARLNDEHQNMLSALAWRIDGGEADASVRMVAALGWYWFLCGHHVEAASWAERALAVPGAPGGMARALVTVMSALTPAAGPEGAAMILDRVRRGMALAAQARRDGEPERLELSVIAGVFEGDPVAMLESTRRLTAARDPWVRACGHLNSGHLHATWGQAEQAEGHFTSALAESRSIGERWGQVQALSGLAKIAGGRGDTAAAVRRLHEALRLAVELGARQDEAMVRGWLGAELAHNGDLAAARRELDTALTVARRAGAARMAPFVRVRLADVARFQGDLQTAARMLAAASAECLEDAVPDIGRLVPVLCGRGHLDVALHRTPEAREQHARAVEHVLLLNDPRSAGGVATLAADIAQAEGDPEHAAALLGLAAALTGVPDHAELDRTRIRDRCRQALGEAAFATAHRRGAAAWKDAPAGELAGVLALASSARSRPDGP